MPIFSLLKAATSELRKEFRRLWVGSRAEPTSWQLTQRNTEKQAVGGSRCLAPLFCRAAPLSTWWSLRFLRPSRHQSSFPGNISATSSLQEIWFKHRNNLKQVRFQSNLGWDEKCQYSFVSRENMTPEIPGRETTHMLTSSRAFGATAHWGTVAALITWRFPVWHESEGH